MFDIPIIGDIAEKVAGAIVPDELANIFGGAVDLFTGNPLGALDNIAALAEDMGMIDEGRMRLLGAFADGGLDPAEVFGTSDLAGIAEKLGGDPQMAQLAEVVNGLTN